MDYSQRVRLLHADDEPRDLSLAEAVSTVMSWDTTDRSASAIVWDGVRIMVRFDIEAHSTRLVHAGFGLGTWTGGFPGTRKRISSMA